MYFVKDIIKMDRSKEDSNAAFNKMSLNNKVIFNIFVYGYYSLTGRYSNALDLSFDGIVQKLPDMVQSLQ